MLALALFVLVVVANIVIANWMLDRELKLGRPNESAGGLFNRKW